MSACPLLLSPLRIGPIEVRNRIVSTAHQTTLVEDGIPTGDFVAYHRARAEGGVGLVCLEATAVHPSGLLTGHTVAGYEPAIVEAFALVADAVHAAGGRVFVQLFHGGREQIDTPPRAPSVAPSAVPSMRFKTEPRALRTGEIDEIVERHETTARHVREAGLDGVELCASHGYLPTQFLSERTNRRDDAWGGDEAGRARYMRRALEAMRRGAGDGLAVGIRLSADETVPEGRTPADSREVLAALAAEGLIDYASVVVGDSATYLGSAHIVPPPPVARDLMRGVGLALHDLGVPLIVTTRVHEPAEAEALLAAGVCDAVGMTRALIADPDLPHKIARGDEDARILCIGCNQGCIGHYHLGLPIACLQNPRTGRERHHRLPVARHGAGHRVLVVGAGPAGLACAVAAARAGDRVTLAESTDHIGGQFDVAGQAPAHREMVARFRTDWQRRLTQAGVELQLSAPVEADDQRVETADRIVLATGARPYRPPLAAGAVELIDAWDAIRDPGAVSGPVLVADWGGGWTGLDAAESLAENGLAVLLAVAAPLVGETVHQYQRVFYLGRLERLGVTIVHHRELAATADGPVLRSIWTQRPEPLPAEVRTVVLALGRVPVDDLAIALEDRGVRFEAVGDCLGPRSAEEAILEGERAGERAATPHLDLNLR